MPHFLVLRPKRISVSLRCSLPVGRLLPRSSATDVAARFWEQLPENDEAEAGPHFNRRLNAGRLLLLGGLIAIPYE
ncbi:hypothetical protein A2U01_0059217, partial [Trifolium medium]|nr:hypothetical protein [Trifolium medium]